MRIVVGIPVYDGKLQIQSVRCLLTEQALAREAGDDLRFLFLPSCSHPAMGRNQLVQDFLDSDADRLVFLDADVTFPMGSLLKIAHHPVDFVGGAYRFKMDEEKYPVGFLPNPKLMGLVIEDKPLIEVQTLPGGFLSLSRNVFEKLKAAHPEREYEHFGRKAHCFFQMPFAHGILCGEDSYFCLEWAALGEKVYLDAELTLIHWDFNTPYAGHIGNWLRTKTQEKKSA